ncbi:MAG: shikimate kinase [Chloroflexi bacterium]|nr:shikimate kinase [Chloroflexota bacterium]
MRINRAIALVGLSGSGKSSVARALALQLGAPLRDTDALVVAMARRSIAAIFAESGEDAFRDDEAAALAVALADPPAVIATGGGIVVREGNRRQLRAAATVWLDAPAELLLARLRAHDEARPLLAGADPLARLAAQRAQRAPWYREVAAYTIDTAGLDVAAVCARICALLLADGTLEAA